MSISLVSMTFRNLFKLKVGLSIFIFALFFSCKTRISDTLPDYDKTNANSYTLNESSISLPIIIPISLIADEINKEFSHVIYEDLSYDFPIKDDIKIRITKTRPIVLTAQSDFFRYDIPLRIWAQYRWKACEFCPQIEKETSFLLNVSFTSKFSISNNWSVLSQTVPTGYQFETKPKLDFGIVSIPITMLIEPIVKEQLVDVAKIIDDEIKIQFDMKGTMDSIWKELHVPQLIDSSMSAWVLLKPNEILMSPIKSNNENLRIMFAFKGFFQIIMGEKPTVTNIASLPLLKLSDTLNNDFSFFLESLVNYDAATKLARQHIKDTVLTFGNNQKVKIEDIQFMGTYKHLFVKVDMSKSINGTVYFKGKPSYDKENKMLFFDEFDFDIKSKNALIKSATWLFHTNFKNRIEKEFRYVIADDIKQAQSIITELLSDYNFDDIFTINGRLNYLELAHIYTEPSGLRLVIEAKGKAQIKINNLY